MKMVANAVVTVLGVLMLAGVGIGMATLAANPFGMMTGGGCGAGQGGCPGSDGGNCPGATGNAPCQNGNYGQTGAACPGIQNGTCPLYNETEGN
jgi:hypothetical protein